MDGSQRFDSFQFDYDSLFDKQVDPVSSFEFDILSS